MIPRKTAATARVSSPRKPLFDLASTKTLLWIILGSVGAVALALVIVALVIAGRGSSRTVAQDNRETVPDMIAAPRTVQPVTPAPQLPSPAATPRPDRTSPPPAQPKSSQPAQAQTSPDPIVVIPATPSRSTTPTEPAVITLGGTRNITIPDPSFETQKDGYFATFPGWTDVYPSTINIMHEVVTASHPNIDGRKFLRLYMDCGGTLLSAKWEFRSPKLGRYEAGNGYRFTVAMSRSGDDDNRKVTVALGTSDAVIATKTIPFGAMNEESFKDFNVDLDVRADSPHVGKAIYVIIRCEAENTRHGRNVNVDNLRLSAQPL